MQDYAPLQLERIALHLNTLAERQRGRSSENILVLYKGRLHVLHSLLYINRHINAELSVPGAGVIFEERLTTSQLAAISLDILAQAEAEVCTICQTWVATHIVQVGDAVYHVCDKPQCQDAVPTPDTSLFSLIQKRAGETL